MNPNLHKRVLIADDESLVMNHVAAELKSLGCVVVGRARDGREAVSQCHLSKPDVVVMDITMPVLDGLSAAEQIQAECPTPVVILSAHEDKGEIVKAARAGVGAYLVKPPRAADLDRAMAIAVARHSDLMELRRVNAELTRSTAEVRTLGSLLPICSSCKKIRDDRGYWNQLEAYITDHSNTQFTHSFCPDCLKSYFPGIDIPTEGGGGTT